jgi:hypothetical protein
METPALNGIRNTADVLDKLKAPVGTSCALQVAFLRNVLIQHEAIREQRTISRLHMPTALTATVEPASHLSAPTQAQTRHVLNPAYENQNTDYYASEGASAFDVNFMDDESWTFMFANAGFNVGEGAFMSPT